MVLEAAREDPDACGDELDAMVSPANPVRAAVPRERQRRLPVDLLARLDVESSGAVAHDSARRAGLRWSRGADLVGHRWRSTTK